MVLSESQKESNKLLHWVFDVVPNKIGGTKFSVALPGEIVDATIYTQESCTTDHHELQFRWYASDLQEQFLDRMSSDHFYKDAFDQELHFIKSSYEGHTWYEAELICKAKGAQLPGIFPIPYLGGLVRCVSPIIWPEVLTTFFLGVMKQVQNFFVGHFSEKNCTAETELAVSFFQPYSQFKWPDGTLVAIHYWGSPYNRPVASGEFCHTRPNISTISHQGMKQMLLQ